MKPGYKQSELGVIPEDWDVVALSEVFDFQNGVNADKSAYGHGVPFINVLEVITHSVIRGEDILGKIHLPAQTISWFAVKNGDILFNRTSETQEELGLAAVFEGTEVVVFGGFVIRAKRRDERLNSLFASSVLRAPSARAQIVTRGQGVVRANIGQRDLSKVKIPLPNKADQEAIAEALSDADALIESLGQLLVKKRQIKLSTTQELLTGKRRLPGFERVWEKRPLRAFVKQFIVPMRDKPARFGGDIPWCRIEDFDGIFLSESKSGQRVNPETVCSMNLKVYPTGTLLVSCSADLGRCAITTKPLVSNQTFIGLEMNETAASNLFFYYLMTSLSKELNNLSSGTTISYLSREKFEDFVVFSPLEKVEQTAIAEVIFDVDNEIAMLETKLTKARQIKQGMMQELLTGRIRLV